MFDSDGHSLGVIAIAVFVIICAGAGALLALSLFGDTGTEIVAGTGAIIGGALGVALIFMLRELVSRSIDGLFHLVTHYPYVTVPLIAIGAGAIWYFSA